MSIEKSEVIEDLAAVAEKGLQANVILSEMMINEVRRRVDTIFGNGVFGGAVPYKPFETASEMAFSVTLNGSICDLAGIPPDRYWSKRRAFDEAICLVMERLHDGGPGWEIYYEDSDGTFVIKIPRPRVKKGM